MPGKRPLSSISPTIAEFATNGSLYYATGAAGGSRIITATLQSLWHALDQHATAAEALAAPRLHDQLVPNTAVLEWAGSGIAGYSNATAAYLRGLGVNVTYVAPGESAAQAIRRLPNGTFDAAADPRVAAGGAFAV